jgi:cytochrome c oxidase subunit 2
MLGSAILSTLLNAGMALMQDSAVAPVEQAEETAPALPDIVVAPTPGGSGFMPPGWSTVSDSVDGVYYFITWLSLFFFVLITVLTVLFAIKYRRTQKVMETGGPTHHTPLELTWSIVPLLIVIAIFYVGMKGYVNLRQAPIDSYTVHVKAQKWTWSFEHSNGANEVALLRVPANRPVRLIMGSEDVLHALFIPAFRVKQDVVPGRLTTLWFEAAEPPDGADMVEFDLMCAEYCGTQHSTMLARVYVYTEEAFEPAIEEAARWIDRVADEDLWWNAGPRIYPRCASCHSLEEGKTLTGPSFRGLYEKIAAGEETFTNGDVLSSIMGPGQTYESPEDYIAQSILNPQKHVVEGFPASMPTFQGQLKDRHIRAMIEFLRNLDKFDNQGKLIGPPPGAGAQTDSAGPQS